MKYSLCIGLNHLDPKAYGGFEGELRNCENDATAMTMLPARYGYVASAKLSPQAERADVRKAVGDLAKVAVAGDSVLIHYSGHGGKVFSQFEQDRADETLCLFDGQMTDNEFLILLGQFRAGVNIVVILDCCYSGGMDRATVPNRTVPLHILKHLPRETPIVTRAPRASVMMLNACKEDETASDGFGNFGAWTEALINSWDEKKPPTWGEWFAAATQICSGQTPQIRAFNAASLLVKTALS